MKEEEDGYGQAAYLHTIDSGAINFIHSCILNFDLSTAFLHNSWTEIKS